MRYAALVVGFVIGFVLTTAAIQQPPTDDKAWNCIGMTCW